MKIDKEFHKLIPPLSSEEYSGLEENIKKNGCLEPLDLWGDTIIDGHNRFEICNKNKILFKTKDNKFNSRGEAIIWIINKQLDRRNISKYDRVILNLKKEKILKPIAKEKLKTHTKQGYQKSDKAVHVSKEIAKLSGVSHDTVAKVKKIQEKATEEQKQKLRSGRRTIHSVYQDIKQQEIKQGIIESPLPKNKFSIIYADPPWQYALDSVRGSVGKHYKTMSFEEILKMKIPSEENSVLFLWATNPKLKEAIQVLDAWGFEYKTNICWIKDKFGTGYWVRGQHELLLIGTKGKVQTPPQHLRFSSVLKAKRTQHSKKPEEFYELIEKMFPKHSYLELFARGKRNGWESWGDEV